jgi:hypothetical protein
MNFGCEDKLVVGEGGRVILCNDCTIFALKSGRLAVVRMTFTVPVPILVTAGQLKPLGNPPPGAVKFFLTAEIEQKKGDARWMNKATELIRLKVKDKNERAAKSRTLKGSVSATNGNNSHDRHS